MATAKLRIVVLDGYTLNPGDLSWAELQSLGACEIHERTPPSAVLHRARGAAIVLTNKVELTAEHVRQLTDLQYIGVLATGVNVVALEAARAQKIVVTNIPTYGTASVAQTTLALLLELTHHVGSHSESVRQGRWTRNRDWCYWEHPLLELGGLTLGLVGFGRIGRAVGKLGVALGMRVLAYDPYLRPPVWVRRVGLETLFRQSDVVSLHCPLTPETHGLVNAKRLALMKPTAFLLNTSRGPLVNEAALAETLNLGRIAGAGLDVLSQEPPPAKHPLLHARNCVITPHLAWATRAARARLMTIAVQNIRAFLNGKPRNVVRPSA